MARLTDDELDQGLAALPDWTREGETIVATIKAPTFPAAIAIVAEAAEVAETMNHHPDIDIRWRTTSWLLTTHDEGGLTGLDLDLAGRISEIARRHGATGDPADAEGGAGA